MKKIISAIICVLTLCFTTIFASAENQYYFYDIYQVVGDTSVSYTKIDEKLESVSKAHGVNIAIVTVEDYSTINRDIEDAARQFGISIFGSNDNNIVFLISMDERDWGMYASNGKAVEAMNAPAREHVFETMKGYLSDNDYVNAFLTFANETDKMLTMAENGSPYKKPFNPVIIVIALAIGLVCALIGTGSMKSQLKSVAAQKSANNYVKSGSFNVNYSRDYFLYKTVSVHVRESSNSSGTSSSSNGSHGKF